MNLEPGAKLGPYEIQNKLGAGGMGDVYLARDSRLGRSVAIKTSHEHFNERFEREARAVAALNHPNICTLYDVGPNYLVMELVEGPTVAERIKEGPLPLEEALTIARQISAALEAAHEKGIVHRDLKPANIKLPPNGPAKVLDFGLAKLAETPAPVHSAESSPTITISQGTQAGMILGTAAYMAPEQARGRPVDKRADIWSFGVVLYEMLTGHGGFDGETVSDVLAAVLTRELDLNKVPFEVRRMLRACLHRDPKDRLRDIADVWKLLDQQGALAQAPAATKKTPWIWPAVAGLAAVAAFVLAFIHFGETPPPVETTRFRFALPERVSPLNSGALALSPDGRKVVFAAIGADGARRLWLHTFDSLDPRPLENTDITDTNVLAWSPDSRYVLYQDRQTLKKADINGGPPSAVNVEGADYSGLYGASWGRDGFIVLGTGRGIVKIPENGGQLTLLVEPKPDGPVFLYPALLPDGKRFLYTSLDSRVQNRQSLTEDWKMLMGSVDAKPEQQSTKVLSQGGFSAPLASTGPDGPRVLFVRDAVLYAQTIDVSGERLLGEPQALAENVGMSLNSGGGLFTVSGNVLVYRSGGNRDLQLTWFDRKGDVAGYAGDPGLYLVLALSPDQKQAVVQMMDFQTRNRDLWLVNLTGPGRTRFTFDPAADVQPIWSRDGKRIAFASVRDGAAGIYVKPTSGAGEEQLVWKSGNSGAPNLTDWSNDGRFLIFARNAGGTTKGDVFVLPVDGAQQPVPFVQSEGVEQGAHFSPDMKLVSYISNESGRNEIYVRPFDPAFPSGAAAGPGKWMISNGALGMARWRKDGKELFYIAPDGSVMSVDVSPGPVFSTPKKLFQAPPAFLRTNVNIGTMGDVAADGERFLFAMPVTPPREEFNVVLHWDVPR